MAQTTSINFFQTEMNAVKYNLPVTLSNAGPDERVITLEEVSWHDNYSDCWVVIYDRVYDITDFLDEVNFYKNSSSWQHFNEFFLAASRRKWYTSGIRWQGCKCGLPWFWTQSAGHKGPRPFHDRRITDARTDIQEARGLQAERYTRMKKHSSFINQQIKVYN